MIDIDNWNWKKKKKKTTHRILFKASLARITYIYTIGTL